MVFEIYTCLLSISGINRYKSIERIKNPYSPGAGAPPPELVGRDPILEEAAILLGRIKLKRPEKSMLLTGLWDGFMIFLLSIIFLQKIFRFGHGNRNLSKNCLKDILNMIKELGV